MGKSSLTSLNPKHYNPTPRSSSPLSSSSSSPSSPKSGSQVDKNDRKFGFLGIVKKPEKVFRKELKAQFGRRLKKVEVQMYIPEARTKLTAA